MTVYRGLPRGIVIQDIRPYLESDANYRNLDKPNRILSAQEQTMLAELHLIHEEADPLAERLFFLQANGQWSEYDDLYNELLQKSEQGNPVAIAALNRTMSFSELFPGIIDKSERLPVSNIETHRIVSDEISNASTEKWFNRFFVFCLGLALLAFIAVGKIGTGLTSELFLPLFFISLVRAIFSFYQTFAHPKAKAQNIIKLISSLLFMAVSIIYALHFVSISSVAGQFSLPSISSVFLVAPFVLPIALALELGVLNYNKFKNNFPNRWLILAASAATLYFTLAIVFPAVAIFSFVATFATPLAILSGAALLLSNYIDRNTLNATAWGDFINKQKIPLWDETLKGITEDIQKLKQELNINIANLQPVDLERIETRLAYLQNQIEIIRNTIDKLPTVPNDIKIQLSALWVNFSTQLEIVAQQQEIIVTSLNRSIQEINLSYLRLKQAEVKNPSIEQITQMRDSINVLITNLESLSRLLTAIEGHHVSLPPESMPITTIRSAYNSLVSTLNQERTELNKLIMRGDAKVAAEKKSAEIEHIVQDFLGNIENKVSTLASSLNSGSSSVSLSLSFSSSNSSLSSATSLSLDRLAELSNSVLNLQQQMIGINKNISYLDGTNIQRQRFEKAYGDLNQRLTNLHITILQQTIQTMESNLRTMGTNPTPERLALLRSLESKYVLLLWNKRLINADVSDDVKKQNQTTAEILSVEIQLEYEHLPQLASSALSSSASSQTNQHRVDALRSIHSRFSRLVSLTNGAIPSNLVPIQEAVEKELAPPANSAASTVTLEAKRS